ncbi:MAG: hypothetical protein NXH75_15075, partial [Halobacteriovoraceae bacterium]|nr:hypothetical protein [Halobacteriovoraceae bacterium]
MLKLLFFTFLLCSCASGNYSIVYTDYGDNAYKKSTNKQYQAFLNQFNGRSADLLFTCYTENEKSSNVDCNSYDSPKKETFFKLVKELKRKGFKVTVRFYIDLKNKEWRALWNPLEPVKAFESIKDG